MTPWRMDWLQPKTSRESRYELALTNVLYVQTKVKIDYRPVHMQPLDKEMEHIPPKVRSY